MYLSRRLIVVFTPAYMTNEWCMYCFSEGTKAIKEIKERLETDPSSVPNYFEAKTMTFRLGLSKFLPSMDI